jgi:UDP-2-acetamido-2,6-beta-L-arabino-hexul-4-ose reductase
VVFKKDGEKIMANILITGSKGFIGTHLTNKFKNIDIHTIYEFNRNDSIELLSNDISKIDFIFHLASEVRPNASVDDLTSSNESLTNKLVTLIEDQNLSIPILFTSSIHAKASTNIYGKSKLNVENILKEYSIKNNIPVYIYQLTHVFGMNCKPNYNSVISTWIYNSINDLDIVIYDRNISMQYMNVNDIVDIFYKTLSNNINKNLLSIKIYKTTLGDVYDYIMEFKHNIKNKNYEILNNDFKKDLFNTYKDYYND